MAWSTPRTWVASEIITAALFNAHIRDNFRYLKGLDGSITFEDDIITSHNVDGVDVSDHNTRHESGGADALAAPIDIAALPNLTQNYLWRGDASNRPVEALIGIAATSATSCEDAKNTTEDTWETMATVEIPANAERVIFVFAHIIMTGSGSFTQDYRAYYDGNLVYNSTHTGNIQSDLAVANVAGAGSAATAYVQTKVDNSAVGYTTGAIYYNTFS